MFDYKKYMQNTLMILIAILTFTVLAVLVVAIFGTYSMISNTKEDTNIFQQLNLLPSIVISAGVLVAIFAFFRERKKLEIERQRHMSEVFLNRVNDGFNIVIKLLSDQNNNRTIWVRAARTLLKSLDLKNRITSEEYKVAYELDEERARNELYTILSLEDEDKGVRVSLPPQFFYGIEDWRTCKYLKDAAIKASSKAVISTITIDKVRRQPSNKPLAIQSVTAIFEFIEYPETYEDPLRLVEKWDDNFTESFGIDQGARQYVAHKRQYIAIGGELHELNQK